MPASTVRTCCSGPAPTAAARRVPSPGTGSVRQVIATGPQASRWRVGDQVCALTPGGGYAQYCLADERHCLPVPRGMDLLTAAAIPENYTVWTNVFERARLAAGERFLVHGGSSGIGLTAIQLARLRRRGLDHGGQRREGGGLHRGRRAAR